MHFNNCLFFLFPSLPCVKLIDKHRINYPDLQQIHLTQKGHSMKKVALSVLTACCVFMFAGVSVAANSWDTCSLERLGVAGTDDNLLKVTDCKISANDGKWLQLVNQKDRSLAVVLTALSIPKKVKLNADFATATTSGSAYGAIEVIYIDQ